MRNEQQFMHVCTYYSLAMRMHRFTNECDIFSVDKRVKKMYLQNAAGGRFATVTTLRDGSDASRRRWRFATAATLRDGNDASRRRRRYATATTLRDGGLRVWRRKGGRAGGGQSKDGFWHGPLLSLAPERENSWTAVGMGGG